MDQLEGVDDHSTVLEVVMSADKEVITWRQQAQLLEVRGPPCACMRTPLLRSHPLLLSPVSKQLNKLTVVLAALMSTCMATLM